MGNEICNKCGAEIPANANFCLSCGAKIEKGSRMEREPIHEVFRFLFSKNLIIAALLLGMLFIWIGILVVTFSNDTTGFRAAQTLNSLGFFITGIFLVGGGIVNDSMDKYVRVGMIVIGVYMITSVLALSHLLSSIAGLYP
jgi:hypothetical protein